VKICERHWGTNGKLHNEHITENGVTKKTVWNRNGVGVIKDTTISRHRYDGIQRTFYADGKREEERIYVKNICVKRCKAKG
jgi:antitoxin component YwqK of YwqJK toxin-antitoxin module